MEHQPDHVTGHEAQQEEGGSNDGQGCVTVQVPQRAAVAIEYPGYIRSVDAALTTLGGEAGITTAVATQAPYLTLRLRPDDPYSHPLFSDKPMPAHSLLLRVSRPKDQPEGSSDGVKVTAVARVTRVYRFSGLADFQFLQPQHPTGMGRLAVSPAAAKAYHALPEDNRAAVAEPFKRQEPFVMVPPLFSRLDMPTNFSFRDSTDRPEGAEPSGWGAAGGSRASRVVSFYDFSLPGTLTPPADIEAQLAARVTELLHERPVWSMQLLVERLGPGITEQAVQPLLRTCCYQFKTGPWKSMYIRCGYDPRSNPDSRPWQRVTYNMTAERHKEHMAQQPPPEKPTISQLNSFSVLPTSRTTHLQLADLQDGEVQRLLVESPTPERVSEAYGWFSPGNHSQIVAAVSAAFKRLMKARASSAEPAAGPSSSGRGNREGSSAPEDMQVDGTSPIDKNLEPAISAGHGQSFQGRAAQHGGPRLPGHKGSQQTAPAAATAARPPAMPASTTGSLTTAEADSADAAAPEAPPAFLAGLMEQLGVGSEQQWTQNTGAVVEHSGEESESASD